MSSIDPTLELETKNLQPGLTPGGQSSDAPMGDRQRRLDDITDDSAVDAGQDLAQVVVSVGTDHHRFDRLIGWMDEWRRSNPGVTVLIQRGTSIASELGGCHELIPHAELLDRFSAATAVVSHGGPSTVMDARMSGRFPIVMARNPAYEEHVDDHQMRFADHLKKHGVADVVDTKDGLFDALDRALTNPDAYTIPISDEAADGIYSFGRLVDGLMGA